MPSLKRKKILLFCPYPMNVAPGQRLKYEQYLNFLRDEGFDVAVSPFLDEATWKILYRPGKFSQKIWGVLRGYGRRLFDLARLPLFDGAYVFLQVTPLGGSLFERGCRLLARKLVYDIDDLVFLGRSSPQNRWVGWLRGPAKYRYLMRSADHVITCTPYLDEYVRQLNSQTTDISSTIRTDSYLPVSSYRNDRPLVIGWSGSHSTVPYLRMLEPVLKELRKKHNFTLRVIGTSSFPVAGVEVEALPWQEASEVKDLQAIDIGLYPLPDEEWVLGKSGLKALQYMALGIPTVATAIGANFRVIEDGVSGFLVKSEAEWLAALEKLLVDAELRRRMGAAARERVVKNYSVKANQPTYLKIFSEVYAPKKRVTYVISEVQNAVTFEWVANSALRQDVNLSFVLLNSGPSELEKKLLELGCEVDRIAYRGRADIFRATLSLYKQFRRQSPEAVHTHLIGANMAGLTAAWLARVPKRIYTRHHSNGNQLGPWYGRFYDLLANLLSTRIVATCDNVKNFLSDEFVPAKKIQVIRFGFDGASFRNLSAERVEGLKRKYRLEGKGPVIGVISRYVSFKGVPLVVEAFSRILEDFPNACLVLANAGNGEAKKEIQNALADLPSDSFREIAFENDCPALMRAFDIFVHVPLDSVSEAFGQVYIEALLSGRPSVFTLSGVAPEFVRDGQNAVVVPYNDANAIFQALISILKDPVLREKISRNGISDTENVFKLDSMIEGLRELYR